MNEIIYSTATQLAQAIREKKVSSEEIVRAHLERIEQVNGRLNAVVQLAADTALEGARRADHALTRDEAIGPLHGVPVTIKDAFETAGIISTGGTLGRKKFVPTTDASAVARLKAAGAIVLGKTNLPEFSMGMESSNLVYGRSNNPYDLGRTPGGSSGGEAAIIAAAASPLGIGSDAGGSLRWPVHCCGIVGLKPTSGRCPRTGHWPPFGGVYGLITQVGPMARSVRDLAVALPILAGMDWLDPTVVPMPLGDPDEVDLHSLRVAFHLDNGLATPTTEMKQAVRRAVDGLEGAVAVLEEKRPEVLTMSSRIYAAIFGADGGESARRYLHEAGSERMSPDLKARIDVMGVAISTHELLDALVLMEEYRSGMLEFMKGYDVMVEPAAVGPAPLHGHGYDGFPESGSYRHAYNMAGWPALVIRGGTSSEGLPLGVQIVSRPWREDLVLAVGAHLEIALGTFPRPTL